MYYQGLWNLVVSRKIQNHKVNTFDIVDVNQLVLLSEKHRTDKIEIKICLLRFATDKQLNKYIK